MRKPNKKGEDGDQKFTTRETRNTARGPFSCVNNVEKVRLGTKYIDEPSKGFTLRQIMIAY
jgi:hypothetical protein